MTKGVPQGSPISPLLANYFLEDFDCELESSGKKLVRYSDDFVILAKSRPQAEAALLRTGEVLARLHLALALEKARVTSFQEGFHFLGAYFHGDDIWAPWKSDKKTAHVIFMARPIPPRLRAEYQRGPYRTAMALALQRVAATATPTNQPNKGSSSVAFLYLTQQGSVLRKTGDRLLVEKDDEILMDLPYHKLDHILVFGNIQITTQAMAEMLEKGVPVSLFSHQGTYRG